MSQVAADGRARTTADTLHLGCDEDQPEDWHNVDINPGVNPDAVLDISEPWPYPDCHFDHVVAKHVFEHLPDIEHALRETARVLRPDGTALVVVPLGTDARADPSHEWGQSGQPWTWTTPEMFCGARNWDVDVGLTVAERSVCLWSHYSGWLGRLHTELLHTLKRRHGPGAWCFNQSAVSGEFEVVFRA